MGRPLVSGNFVRPLDVGDFLFKLFDPLAELCGVLLLPEQLSIQAGNSFVLQGKKRF